MTKPIVIPPGGGEIIGDSPDRRVEVLSDVDELHATWSRFGPGRDGAGRHIHYDHHDLFYVLEGELTVKIETDEEMTAGVGTLVCIPPMVVHGFRNAGDVDVKYLNLHAPGCGFMDYMRGLRDGITVEFDQHDPEGVEGLRPSSEITIGFSTETDALTVRLATEALGQHRSGGLESFYILDGEIVFELDDGVVHAPAGVWVQHAPATAYALSVGGDGAEYLALTSSAG